MCAPLSLRQGALTFPQLQGVRAPPRHRPLLLAIERGLPDVVTLLLDRGADCNHVRPGPHPFPLRNQKWCLPPGLKA